MKLINHSKPATIEWDHLKPHESKRITRTVGLSVFGRFFIGFIGFRDREPLREYIRAAHHQTACEVRDE